MEENKDTVIVGLEKKPLKTEREEIKRKRKHVILIIVLCVLFLIIGLVGGIVFEKTLHPTNKADHTNTFGEIEAMLEQYWVYANDYDDLQKELEDKAFYGMTYFEDDPYTTYMSADELKDFTNGINMDYVGIGVEYSTQNGQAVVLRVFANSPAEKSGLKAGDILSKVDGVSIEGFESEDIKTLVLGEPQTEVVITVIRNNTSIDFSIIRDSVDSSVYCYTQDDYVVMELSSFGASTGKECMAYLDQYVDYKGIIIDLRNNSGGYQSSVKEIAGLFVGNNEVYLRQVDSLGNETSDVTSCIKTYDNFDNIILLVNNQTASAAEVFTICLKEHLDNVIIVGETTYGKGVIQTTHYLANGGVLKFTSFNWYSPNGVSINKVGINPDVGIKLDDIAYEYYIDMDENEIFEYDCVSEIVAICEKGLKFLGYDVERTDGYFDKSFKDALNEYKINNNLNDDAILDISTYDSIIADAISELSNPEKDYQFKKAIELVKE